MAAVQNIWQRNFPERQGTDPKEELLVFGYSCKIFRDDEKAMYIDQGKHLIPWMGDESMMIDRYDVRGYLHDLREFEAKPDAYYFEELSEEEKRLEELCEEERYLALNKDLTEEEMYHEEELKRLRAALACDGAYHEMSFTYDSQEDGKPYSPSSEDATDDDPDDEPYQIPTGLTVPPGMPLPPTMKIHVIIEKTAVFVSQHGGQMEIIIKMKQANNPQFSFLSFEDNLNPYYKHLVKKIKAGKYIPQPSKLDGKRKKQEEEDEDDEDAHYLHPSLMSGQQENIPKFTVPNISFRRASDDSYSLLVKNLQNTMADACARSNREQQQREQEIQQQQEEEEEDEDEEEEDEDGTEIPSLQPPPLPPFIESTDYNSDYTNSAPPPPGIEPVVISHASGQPPPPGEGPVPLQQTQDGTSVSRQSEGTTAVIIPPQPDIQPVIDKMAEYVAKNGEDFETIVKSKNDKRFDFLQPWHEYYPYYIYKRKLCVEQRLMTERVQAPLFLQDPPPPPPPPLPQKEEPIQDTEEIVDEQNMEEIESKEEESHEEENVEERLKEESVVENKEDVEEQEDKQKTSAKIIKGPISFSIRPKDGDGVNLEKKKTRAILLDDDSEEDEVPESKAQSAGGEKEKTDASSSAGSAEDPVPADSEDQQKKLKPEKLEAKLAEEKLKDKLAAAARERLAQQWRDRQKGKDVERHKGRDPEKQKGSSRDIERHGEEGKDVDRRKESGKDTERRKENGKEVERQKVQLERKRKAALFLNLLKAAPSNNKEEEKFPFIGPQPENGDEEQVIYGPHPEPSDGSEVTHEVELDIQRGDDFNLSPLTLAVTSPLNSRVTSPERRCSPLTSVQSSPLLHSEEKEPEFSAGSSSSSSSSSPSPEPKQVGLLSFISERKKKSKSKSHRKKHTHSKSHSSLISHRSHSKGKKRSNSQSRSRSSHKKSHTSSISSNHKHRRQSRSRSRSQSRYQDKRHKTPPAAYAVYKRSVTRSPSPKRHRLSSRGIERLRRK